MTGDSPFRYDIAMEMLKNITFDIKYGSVSIEHSPMIKDIKGHYKIGPSRIVERDEYGVITRDELINPAVQLVYQADDKKWWEIWK